MTRVKVCGLVRLEDAEHAAECGADALGFVFEPESPRFVGSSGVPRRLGPYVLCVAVFGVHAPSETGCCLVQCTEGSPVEASFVRALRLGPESTARSVLAELAAEPRPPAAVLLDAYAAGAHGGTGLYVDWGLAAELVAAIDAPVILAGGLHPGNVAQAIRQVKPYAVDASSGLERSPGVKDPEKVGAFVAEAKGA